MILRLALRYSFSPIAHHRRRSIRIMVTAALSLAVFVTVIAIMDYLQDARIERLRDTQSFDIVVDGSFASQMEKLFPAASVFVYGEAEALAEGRAVDIRFIDGSYDGGLEVLRGDCSSLMVSYQLLSLSDDGNISITMLAEGRSGMMVPASERIPVSGIYATALGSSFDSAHVFMPLSSAGEGTAMKTAVKGADPASADMLREMGYSCMSWMERESVLYSAFMTEKTMMVVVLSFLFLILLVSMKECVRSFYEARRGEKAELMLLGLGRRRTELAFMLSFMIVLAASLLLAVILSAAAIAVSGRYLSSLMFREASLSFPIREFISASAALAAFSLLIAFIRERKEGRKDILEVLIGR